MSWLVSQLGARQHYAVPRALYRKKCLELFYTDAWCRYACKQLRHGPRLVRAFANRTNSELPNDIVESDNISAFWHAITSLVHDSGNSMESFQRHHLHVGEAFARNVVDSLRKRSISPESHVYFGFCTGSLEVLEYLKETGVRTIVDQISPGPLDDARLQQENENWPGWQDDYQTGDKAHSERLLAEWDSASLVLVNSEWSKKSLIEQGVSREKIIVVPLAYERETVMLPGNHQFKPKRRVLWAGSVSLRKGIQYLFEAAMALEKENVEFLICGSILIKDSIIANAPGNMKFLGHMPRDAMRGLYESSDIFVFPTLSDGFGITQIEAMSYGLPVIATPNCGEVVQHGHNGLIVPARDSQALTEALLNLVRDTELLESMSLAALERVKDFSINKYADNLFDSFDAACDLIVDNHNVDS